MEGGETASHRLQNDETLAVNSESVDCAQRCPQETVKPVKRRRCIGGTRKYYKFNGYHFNRPTQVFFRCEHCPFEEEVVEWLYVKSLQRWCLHLGKFHKCNRGPKKTVKCSQKILPDHAKGWPTISNDTAKKFLKADDLIPVAEAPHPEPLVLPLPSKAGQQQSSPGFHPGKGSECAKNGSNCTESESCQMSKHGKFFDQLGGEGSKTNLLRSVSRKAAGKALGHKRTINGKFKSKSGTCTSELSFEEIIEGIDYTPFKNDTAQSLLLQYSDLDLSGACAPEIIESEVLRSILPKDESLPSVGKVESLNVISKAPKPKATDGLLSAVSFDAPCINSTSKGDASGCSAFDLWFAETKKDLSNSNPGVPTVSSADAVTDSLPARATSPEFDFLENFSSLDRELLISPPSPGGESTISNLQLDMYSDMMMRTVEQGFVAGTGIAEKAREKEDLAGGKMLAEDFAGRKMLAEDFAGRKMLAEDFAGRKMLAEDFAGRKMLAEDFAGRKMLAEDFAGRKMLAEDFAGRKMLAEDFAGRKLAAEDYNVNNLKFLNKNMKSDFDNMSEAAILKENCWANCGFNAPSFSLGQSDMKFFDSGPMYPEMESAKAPSINQLRDAFMAKRDALYEQIILGTSADEGGPSSFSLPL